MSRVVACQRQNSVEEPLMLSVPAPPLSPIVAFCAAELGRGPTSECVNTPPPLPPTTSAGVEVLVLFKVRFDPLFSESATLSS